MKYKSSGLLFIVLIGLAGFAWYMFGTKTDKIAMLMVDRDFAVKDIKQIQKIFLATRDKEPITLEKINGIWMLNGKYKAAPNPIKNLLETMRDIRIQSIPSRGHHKTIMEGMAVYGIKVEIYGTDNDLLKTYYVGGGTQSEYGTYYYMEHGSQPYIMEIPHFVGNVRERYDLDLTDWRDLTVFDIPVSSFEKVYVEYPYQPEHSFLIKQENQKFGLYNFENPNQKIDTKSDLILKSYLENFERLVAEDIQNANPMRQEAMDLRPYCVINIHPIGKSEPMNYKFYPVKADTSGKVHFDFDEIAIEKGDLFRWHIARSDNDFLLVQYPNIESILKWKEDFK